MSTLLTSSLCAGLLIKDIAIKGKIIALEKGPNNPFTNADILAQKYYTTIINKEFSNLNIIAEESSDHLDEFNYNFLKFNSLIEKIPEVFNLLDLHGFSHERENINNITLIIDPLDGTKDFISKKYSNVTSLVGVTINGIPKYGLICTPFRSNEKIITYFNIFGKGLYQIELSNYQSPHIQIYKVDTYSDILQNRTICCCGRKYFNQRTQELIELIQPQQVEFISCCGAKLLSIIKGECDIYLHVNGWLSKWDICGPHAILNECKGELTTIDGTPFNYLNKIMDVQSILCTKNKLLHQDCLKKIMKKFHRK